MFFKIEPHGLEGQPKSEKHKKALRAAKRKVRKPVIGTSTINPNLQIYLPFLTADARFRGSNIRANIRKDIAHYKQFIWRYANAEEIINYQKEPGSREAINILNGKII